MNSQIAVGSPVFVAEAGTVLERLPPQPNGKVEYDEKWLQDLIHEHPACLPLAEIVPGIEPVTAICRELGVASGFVDNLLMTGKGDLVLVETKLARNPGSYRQVLAQVLDYAVAVFGMSYTSLESAALSAASASGHKPASLYDAVAPQEKLDRQAFELAVSRNLRQGRAIVLVVGDEIRPSAEALLDGLNAHATFSFTLALVELGVYRMPAPHTGRIVRPRTLAKTSITHRTVVEIHGAGASVVEKPLLVPETPLVQQYWDDLEAKVPGGRIALEALVKAAEPLGIYPEVLGSLNLKWARPGGKPVNLAYFQKDGMIWTDAAAWSVPSDIVQAYVEAAATALGCAPHKMPSGAWTLYKDGKPLRLKDAIPYLQAWPPAMQRFIEAISAHDQAGTI